MKKISIDVVGITMNWAMLDNGEVCASEITNYLTGAGYDAPLNEVSDIMDQIYEMVDAHGITPTINGVKSKIVQSKKTASNGVEYFIYSFGPIAPIVETEPSLADTLTSLFENLTPAIDVDLEEDYDECAGCDHYDDCNEDYDEDYEEEVEAIVTFAEVVYACLNENPGLMSDEIAAILVADGHCITSNQVRAYKANMNR